MYSVGSLFSVNIFDCQKIHFWKIPLETLRLKSPNLVSLLSTKPFTGDN